MVDVVLAAALGGLGDVSCACALGADEQHAAAGGGDVAHGAAARDRSSGTVCCRSMMWTWLRTPKMYGAIRGFQRRVWWPKWTPASRSWRMVNIGHRHGNELLLRLSRRGGLIDLHATPERSSRGRPHPRVRFRAPYIGRGAAFGKGGFGALFADPARIAVIVIPPARPRGLGRASRRARRGSGAGLKASAMRGSRRGGSRATCA